MRPALLRQGGGARLSIVLAAAVVTACGPATPVPSIAVGGASSPVAAEASPAAATGSLPPGSSPALTPDQALALYGGGATKDTSITYQPDVVFITGGPSIVRSASANGLTWAIDRNAPGAADLAVGSVMVATSLAAGRVVAITDEGDSRVVTIAPIELTDIVKDGSLQASQGLDFAGATYRQLPADFPAILPNDPSPSPSPSGGADTTAPGETLAFTLPAIRLASARMPGAGSSDTPPNGSSGGQLSWPVKLCPDIGIGEWSVKACAEGDGLTISVDAKPDQKLKVGFSVKLYAKNLRADAGTVIKDGQVVDSGGWLDGLDGVQVKVYGGAKDGAQDNTKLKFEVPVEIDEPGPPVAGIPTRLRLEAKLTIETAFSGKNSTLSSSADYKLDGPIGVQNGQPDAPKVSVLSSILDNMTGIALGASGIIFGIKWKFQWGVGIPGFVAGPYGTLTMVFSIGRGSVIGTPIADCKGATFDISAGAGLGLALDPSRIAWLAQIDSVFTKYVKAKVEEDIVKYTLVSIKAVQPDVPICRG